MPTHPDNPNRNTNAHPIGDAARLPGPEPNSKTSFGNSFFEISLAEWSLHNSIFANRISNLEFPVIARKEFDIGTVEYVNQFFKDKARDRSYLQELLHRCNDHGIRNHLIMCDDEGPLADPDDQKRLIAVENHYKWVEAAKFLSCSSIRVNTFGEGTAQDVQQAAIDGISRLAEFADQEAINILVENHGGYTSDGKWLVDLIEGVNKENVGSLPDFGNFCMKRENDASHYGKCLEEYDRYLGVTELMPFAKGVSAKSMRFDADGNCIETDYYRMLKIVRDSGFHGYIGIEYSSTNANDEAEGIRKTKTLIERVARSI